MKTDSVSEALLRGIARVRPRVADMMSRHTVTFDTPMRQCLVALNRLSGETMTLFVVDDEGRMAGTMTDGDIRRALIAGAAVTDRAELMMHRDFLALRPTDTPYVKIAEARHRGITLLPRLDNEGYVVDIIDMRRQHSVLPVDAVLMAGGRGERLRPLTLTTPKPLLEVGGKPIIDYNVEELLANGITTIRVTVNYLKDQLIEHFALPRFEEYVRCVEESKRLGTMGSLSLIDDLSNDFVLVMNSDILTTLDFEKLYLAHLSSGADLTMAVIPYTVSVPFSIIRTEGARVTGLTEKPTYNYFAGAGVYLMNRELVSLITPGEYLDAPDFIESLIASGRHVGYFPIDGTWIDIGSPDDYRYADELMSRPAQPAG